MALGQTSDAFASQLEVRRRSPGGVSVTHLDVPGASPPPPAEAYSAAMLGAAAAVRIPVHWVASEADACVPIERARALYGALGSQDKQLLLLQGSRTMGMADLEAQTSWLLGQLSEGVPPVAAEAPSRAAAPSAAASPATPPVEIGARPSERSRAEPSELKSAAAPPAPKAATPPKPSPKPAAKASSKPAAAKPAPKPATPKTAAPDRAPEPPPKPAMTSAEVDEILSQAPKMPINIRTVEMDKFKSDMDEMD